MCVIRAVQRFLVRGFNVGRQIVSIAEALNFGGASQQHFDT